jgi:hypothetical protein
MDLQHAPTTTAENIAQGNTTGTRLRGAPDTILRGRWLLLARSVWIFLVLLTIGIFVASLPVYFALFHTVCSVAAQCANGQLSANTAPVIHSLGLSLNAYAVIALSIKVTAILVWLLIPALIFWRKSDDWLALLVALMFISISAANADNDPVKLTHLFSSSLTYFIMACYNFLSTLSFFLTFSLFPDGRFVPRWTRWVLPFALAWGIVNFLPSLSSTLFATLFGDVTWAGGFSLLALAQIYRYRRVSNPRQRQQIKWVAWSLPLVISWAIVSEFVSLLIFPSLGQADSPYQLFGTVLGYFIFTLPVPLSFGIALLRYRLWDVDILINRTLVYGTLTVLLAALYAGLVIGLESLAEAITGRGSQQPVVLVISTLAIVALSQPLRRRIQNTIDRRFYRRKYDATRTLATFSETLRHEVDLATLREHLVAVVQETMQPASVSLWLRPPAQGGNYQTAWRSVPATPSGSEAKEDS